MLSEVIRTMIEQQPDMVVVTEVYDPIELLFAVKEILVDVIIIIIPVKVNGMPKICRRLLIEKPLLKIMTITTEGKSAILYQSDCPDTQIDKPSKQTVIDVIRKSIQ